MNGEFRGDLARMLGPVGASPFRRLLFVLLNSELHCVASYRFGRFSARMRRRWGLLALPVEIIYGLWHRWCTHLHHCDIDRRAQIGPGLLLMHRHGITIGPIIAGRDLTVYQNVTVGLRVAHNDQGIPRFGSRIWLGPGATVTGAISVGGGTTISAGSVLSKDVPERSLVAGNPGRVIAADYDNSTMVNAAEAG